MNNEAWDFAEESNNRSGYTFTRCYLQKFHLLSVAQVGNQLFDTRTSEDKLYPNHSTVGFPHNCKYSKKEMEG